MSDECVKLGDVLSQLGARVAPLLDGPLRSTILCHGTYLSFVVEGALTVSGRAICQISGRK